MYKIEPRMQICLRNPRIACSTNLLSNIPLGELNSEKNKIEASLKILFTIRGFYTHEGLSNYTTFRPIQSGATVPLTYVIVQLTNTHEYKRLGPHVSLCILYVEINLKLITYVYCTVP